MNTTGDQPRRRRRAARRAAGPPARLAKADIGAEAGADVTATAEVAATADIPATAATPATADPDAPTAGEPAAHTPARINPGSPGDAPGHHHPGPPTHPPVAGQGHHAGPGQATPDRTERGTAGSGDPRRTGRSAREDAAERSLRSLVTTRTTQVSPTAALRARELALPSAADLAAAEEELVLVRRHYVPPTALASGRRQDWPNRRGATQSRNQGKTQ